MPNISLPPLWEVEGGVAPGQQPDAVVATLAGAGAGDRKCLVRFRATDKAHALRLAACYGIKAAPEDVREVRDVETAIVLMQEAGEWARHYSTVRMTVTTFLVTLSAGILSFRWGSWGFAGLAAVVWGVACLFFCLFTRPEWREMDRREKYLAVIRFTNYQPQTAKERLKKDAGAIALLALTTVFLIGCVISGAQSSSGSADQPLRVRIVE